ncbi:MAG: hypothetical protein LBU17_08280 [Treponema sp.]|nr:hypothetical protein [Treponema sp.]
MEQVVRAALFKELKGITYEELAFQQEDLNICRLFLKLETGDEYSFKTWHKFISKDSEETLKKFLVGINTVAIKAGLEDVSKMREDSIVIETNIHYPTSNSLVWNCVKESHRLLSHLKVFSIYEEHTAIIVKGRREVKFGHKVDVVTGKSNVILGVNITEGNPADSTLFKEALDTLVQDYDLISLRPSYHFPSYDKPSLSHRANAYLIQNTKRVRLLFKQFSCQENSFG